MTEEPKIFGEAPPFTLVHGDDVNEVTQFLEDRGVLFSRTLSGPSLYKLQFMGERAENIQRLMRELLSWSANRQGRGQGAEGVRGGQGIA